VNDSLRHLYGASGHGKLDVGSTILILLPICTATLRENNALQ
jgi:hypothetical protein